MSLWYTILLHVINKTRNNRMEKKTPSHIIFNLRNSKYDKQQTKWKSTEKSCNWFSCWCLLVMKLLKLQNNQNFRWSLVDCLEFTIFVFVFYICIIDFKNSNIDNSINSKTLCVCICLLFQSLFEHKVTIISHTEYVCWFTKVYKFVYLFLHNHCGHLLHNNNHYHFTTLYLALY